MDRNLSTKELARSVRVFNKSKCIYSWLIGSTKTGTLDKFSNEKYITNNDTDERNSI